MRRQRLADPRHLGLVLDPVPEGLAGHLLATQTGEQHIAGTPAEQFTTGITHVTLDPDNRLLAHWHQTLLAALTHHPQDPLAQIDLFQGQADQFRHTQPAGIQHLKHGAITLSDGFAQIRRFEQCFYIGFRQGFGQRTTELRHIHAQGGIDRDQFFPQ
ncbi:hypothetical protein D3C81_1814530 [compost metagenome]